jgi:hypothetical protein
MSAGSNNETQNENLNTGKKKRRGGSQKTSWVWQWFESSENGATCKVEVGEGVYCERFYKNGSSTGNLISHLNNKHQITDRMQKNDFVVRIVKNFFIFISFID